MGSRSWAIGFLILEIGMAAALGQDLEWAPYAQRTALLPDLKRSVSDPSVLTASGKGNFNVNGGWRTTAPVQAGRWQRFEAWFRSSDVESISRSVLAQIDWRSPKNERVSQPEFPELSEQVGDWQALRGFYLVPEGATSAVVDLTLRWAPQGSVTWRDVTFLPADPPARRPVTLAAVHHRPQSSSGPDQNRREFSAFLDQAGTAGADLVLLPEGMTMVGTRLSYLDVGEPVPGPTTQFLAQIAQKHRMYVVAGIVEQEGDTYYNTAILLDRQGQLAGRYRKVSLPREEIEGGLTPGESFPVFDLDFGRVGILICWDIQFPGGAARLAQQGAEVILLPIWGGIEELYPARAIENQIYLVSSSYDSPTAVWNHRGEQIALAPSTGGLAVARIDLSEKTFWEWLGHLRARIWREAPLQPAP